MAQFLDYTGLGHFKDKNDALYAKQNGSYEGMTVGNAEQLVSTVGVEDSAPYTFRTTGGSADVGDRMNLKAVVGGTVAWNQLSKELNSTNWTAESGVTASYTDGVATISSTTASNGIKCNTGVAPVAGHKYYLAFSAKSDSPVTFKFGYASASGVQGIVNTISSFARYEVIKNCTTATLYGQIFFLATTTYSNVQAKDAILIDLTAMFGSTIADYIYSLEQSNAGAGIAWLKKYGYFTKPYYPYAAASLQSVKTSAHKTIGFNQWDEQWESGAYNPSTGAKISMSSCIRCKNLIPVIPSTTYYVKAPNNLVIMEYDANNGFIANTLNNKNTTFTTRSATGYIAFYTVQTAYDNDICINLHWDGERDGEYEPYEEHTYALDDVELRGILKLDASNNLYADGDRYLPDGTVERRYKMYTFNGGASESWTIAATGTNRIFRYNGAFADGIKNAYGLPYIANWAFPTNIINNMENNGSTDWTFRTTASTTFNGDLLVSSPVANVNMTLDEFKAKLSSTPLVIVAELATPTTETADPYQQTQIVDDFGTEEFVDAAVEANERDVAIPVGHETFYQNNLKAKLEMAPNSPDGDGDYLVRQTNGVNEYVLFSEVKELPDYPTTDGTYVLKCTVADGTATLSWVSEE